MGCASAAAGVTALPWFTLALAGWRIRLACDVPALAAHIAGRYAPFLAPGAGSADAQVTILLDPALPDSERPRVPVQRQQDICILDVPGACGRIALTFWDATLKLKCEKSGDALEHLLQVLIAYLALRQGGLLFHAAGLLADEEVFLFTGGSGSGKSTVAALSPDKLALNDDMILLRPEGAGWRAYGTPFWNGETTRRDGQTAAGPVAGIYRLVQDRGDYLEPVTPAIAASELVANCPVVNGDPAELPAVMDRCRELVRTVPLQRLHFRKSPDFWAILRGRSIG